jgi:hypothetical protein
MTLSGGCLCRAVRYTVAADAVATRVCWCRDCQYLAAGSATVNNVVYTCSGMRFKDRVILPYAVSDTFSTVATMKISALIGSMQSC